MIHSNLSNSKSLRKANYFLFGLTGISTIILILALFSTYKGLLPGFHSIIWLTTTTPGSPFFLSTVFGTIFIYLCIFNWHDNNTKFFLIGSYLFAVLLFIANHIQLINIPDMACIIALILWSCCIATLIRSIIKTTGNERAININLCLTLILPVIFITLTNFSLALTIIFHPKTDDILLMTVDAALGIQPSFLAGQYFAHLPMILIGIIKLIYLGLPFSLAIVYVGRFFQEKKLPLELMIEFFLIGLGGMLLYHINTGCGPINAFKTIWPQQLPVIPLHPQPQLCEGSFLPRNCLPSLHTAWSVCLWRHSLRCSRAIRIIVLICVIGTLVATLGLGQHYLVDLVMGFAFATACGGLCAINLPLKQIARRNAIIGGSLLCIIWYFLINFGLPLLRISPLIAWFCYLASIYLTAKLELALMRAQKLLPAHNRIAQDTV